MIKAVLNAACAVPLLVAGLLLGVEGCSSGGERPHDKLIHSEFHNSADPNWTWNEEGAQ